MSTQIRSKPKKTRLSEPINYRGGEIGELVEEDGEVM